MAKERGILDVRDETNKVIYDFKFWKAGMGPNTIINIKIILSK